MALGRGGLPRCTTRPGVSNTRLGVHNTRLGVYNTSPSVPNTSPGVSNTQLQTGCGLRECTPQLGVAPARKGQPRCTTRPCASDTRLGVSKTRLGVCNTRLGVTHTSMSVSNPSLSVSNTRQGCVRHTSASSGACAERPATLYNSPSACSQKTLFR